MKKINLLILSLFLFTFIVNFVAAQQDPADVGQVIGGAFNGNQSKIPTTPEDIEQLRQNFLKQQWTEIISKNKVLGPLHNFFVNNTIIFQILFAHPYELSLTLFGIIILWFFFMTKATKIIDSTGLVKGGVSVAIGAAFAIILAQTRLLKTIVTFTLDVMFKQSSWWFRIIIAIIAFGFLALAHVVLGLISQNLKAKGKEK